MKGRWWVLAAVPTLLLLWNIFPLVSGSGTLYLRDVLNTHLLLRAYLAQELPQGRVPTLDPFRAGGQPLAGNPNALAWYPDNVLLFFGISPLYQLNAHFWLHWLLGTCGMGWLARSRGQSWGGAVGAMAAWAFSGYWYSQMNLANAVAPIALVPWLAVAVARSAEEPKAGRATAAAALLWALELVGGDPALAAFAAVLAGVLLFEAQRAPGWGFRLGLSGALGTAMAAPQLVETFRVLPGSFRAVWGYGDVHPLHFGPLPRQLFDVFLPLLFGRPDLGVDWLALGEGPARLYYSLAPGLLFLAVAAAGLGTGKTGEGKIRLTPLGWLGLAGFLLAFLWPWAGVLRGAPLPGTDVFRYPVKFLLWTAVALAVAVGRGTDELLRGERWGRFRAWVLSLLALEFGLWLLLSSGVGPRLVPMLAPEVLPRAWDAERMRWAGSALIQSAALFGAVTVSRLRKRSSLAALTAVLALASASQVLLHRPLVATDERAFYERAPARLGLFPEGAVLCHGAMMQVFGHSIGYGVEPPDRRLLWVFRRAHERLFSYVAPLHQRRMECATSPEGLDGFVSHASFLALRRASDPERVQLLRALGVDYLLLERPLAEEVSGVQVVDGPAPDGGGYVYRMEDSLEEVQLLGTVEVVPTWGQALRRVMEPGFRPREVAVLYGQEPEQQGLRGEARLLRNEPEYIEVEVNSRDGGVLVLRRSYLPLWKAWVDGQQVAPVPAQAARLGVRVPPGPHRVVLWIDPLPRQLALAGSGVAFCLAAALFLRRPR